MSEIQNVNVEADVKVDAIPEMIEEVVAKYFENQSSREKKFNLTGSAVDEAVAKEGSKWGTTIKFLNALKDGDRSVLNTVSNERSKVLNETTGNQGGFLVPEEFETSIVEYINDFSEIRRNATVLPMRSDVKRLNSLATRVNAFYENELGSSTYSESTFGEPVLTARRLSGLTSLSEELLMDTEIAIVQNLAQQFGEAMAQREQTEFATGTVSGSEGLLVVSGTTGIALTSGTTFNGLTWDDLGRMQTALFNVSKAEAKTAKFYMSMPVYQILRTLKSTGDGNYFNLPIVPAQDQPAMAWGREIVVLNEFPTVTATATKFVVFSDLRNHAFIGDRMGIRLDIAREATVGGVNMFTTFSQGIRAVKRTAFCTALPNGIVTLSTN